MAIAAKQRSFDRDVGEVSYKSVEHKQQGYCAIASKPEHNSYTYQATNGCEVTACFAEEPNEGLVQTVLGMLLQDTYREE